MSNAGKILELTRNKKKRLNLAFNKKLFAMFSEESKKDGIKPNQKIEELILTYLEKKGKI